MVPEADRLQGHAEERQGNGIHYRRDILRPANRRPRLFEGIAQEIAAAPSNSVHEVRPGAGSLKTIPAAYTKFQVAGSEHFPDVVG